MAFMIPGCHLGGEPLTMEDIANELGIPGGFKESSSKGKVCYPVTPQRGGGNKHQQRFQLQTEGGDSVKKVAEYEADEEESDHQEDENTRTPQDLQIGQGTAATTRAAGNRIDQVRYLLLPNQGK